MILPIMNYIKKKFTVANKLLLNRKLYQTIFICILTLFVCVRSQGQSSNNSVVKISVNPKIILAAISPDFIGLGYETSAVAQPNYFSGQNSKLIQLYHNLNPHGLIRIGGNISDQTKYVTDSTSIAHTEKEVTIINHNDLVNLQKFSRATGWKVMWGLNLGTGSKEEAKQEAVAVAGVLGNDLHSFQIGNEVDLQSNYHRKYNNFQSYFSDFLSYKAAIISALPNAIFSGPDVAGNINWFSEFANKATDIKLLTYHYYRTGSHSPNATIEALLSTDSAWNRKLKQLEQISQKSNVPYRINEVNSFSGGGKPGVSNTFASALWCLDYMFQLATHGCNGVNMETDINQLGWISHYSPIIHDKNGNVSVRPEYYGILAFGMAGKGDLIKLSLDKDTINLSAYATIRKDKDKIIWITVINKDISRDATLEVALPQAYSQADAFWLKAPNMESEDHVTLAGTEVSGECKWRPKTSEKMIIKDGSFRLQVAHASAVLLRLKD
ncbi:MAG: hypothetical protein ABI359_06515 [Ginsengibacter sp.]